jgi:hypothetical protein
MDVALLDCVFPEAPRPVYKGGRGQGCFLPLRVPENPNFSKPLARSPALLVLLLLQRSGPRQADCVSPPTVRSNVFFLICCECVIGPSVIRENHE